MSESEFTMALLHALRSFQTNAQMQGDIGLHITSTRLKFPVLGQFSLEQNSNKLQPTSVRSELMEKRVHLFFLWQLTSQTEWTTLKQMDIFCFPL